MPERTNATQVQPLDWDEVCPGDPDPNERILVAGDLHQRLDHAEYWCRQKCDRLVFLGDFFDAHGDSAKEARTMALWVREQAHNPRCTLLLGNHCVHHRWPDNEELIYPGYAKEKARAINQVLKLKDWNRMRLACKAGNFLCSHAGFSPVWVQPQPPTLENILARCQLAEERAAKGILDPVFGYGELPGGVQKFGGPLAMDFGYFVPIPGINQIVGHTPGDEVRVKAGQSCINVCIDVGNGAVAALVQGGHIEILRTPTLSSP